MKRRDFITLLGGAMGVWPLAGRAQTNEPMPRIGILMPFGTEDPQYRARIGAFVQGLQEQGYSNGRNVRLEFRASAGNADEIRRYASELVALAPKVILGTGVSTVLPLQQATQSIPIVFTVVPDPVGAGIVASLSRPGGMRLAFRSLNTVSVENGSNFSRRLRPT
jgi:putative ABC transport system substrate-binding protein